MTGTRAILRRLLGGARGLFAAVFAVSATGVAASLAWASPTSHDVRGATALTRGALPEPGSNFGRPQEAPPYDGHYQFVRVRFEPRNGLSAFSGFGRGREPDWAHDWPRAERNFLSILDELTTVSPTPGEGTILSFDDPEIFRYPVAYVVEVGSWAPSEREVTALGEYLDKGGFLIVDDFRGNQIYQLEAIFGAAIPGARIQEVPVEHPIFDSFFRIEDPYQLAPPTFQQYRPVYLGVFEDNDPEGRLMAMLNYNNDIAEYWETSGRGWYLVDLENEAFKFGVNYVVYAMTH